MTMKLLSLAGALLTAVTALPVSNATAQKKDNIQEESVWASDLHVDGKPDDWTEPLEAENRNTNLSYTLANDNENLYLMIQSGDVSNNTKILLGGISLSVNTDGKKKLDDAYSITFPYAGQKANEMRRSVTITSDQLRQLSKEQVDSLQAGQGNSALEAMKDIRVDGIKEVSDSLISIYNEYGLKAAANFNDQGLYTYELSIPLKVLGLQAESQKEFSYNLMVNGLDAGNRGFRRSRNFSNNGRGRQNADYLDLISPTDFWGKYKLATPGIESDN